MIFNFTFHSIRARILFWFCSISALSLLIIGAVLYYQRTQGNREREFDKLRIVRDLKAYRINTALDRIHGDLEILAGNPQVVSSVRNLCNGGEADPALHSTFAAYIKAVPWYQDFLVVSLDSGRVLYSTGPVRTGSLSDFGLRPEGLRLGETLSGDVTALKRAGLSLYVAAPVTGAPGGCAITARVSAEAALFPGLFDSSGLSDSGETVLVARNMTMMSGRSGRDLNRRANVTDALSRNALQGGAGVAEEIDYRGELVLAAYAYIPRLQWAIVVKQDAGETDDPSTYILGRIFVFIVLFLAAMTGAALLVSQDLTRPIRSMIEVSRRIRKGDLAARNNIRRGDELKYLADSFNKMADSVVSELDFQRTCSDLIEVMLSTIDLNEFSSNLLKKMIEVSGSSIGAFYILSADGSEFRHLSSIGLDAASIATFHAEKLEGEFGRALATRKITTTGLVLDDSRIRLRTIIGDIVPRVLMTIPVIVNDRCVAIISLASLQEYDHRIMRILDQIWLVMNAAFSNILAIDERRRLSGELEDKNRLLEKKREALQQQAYELKKQTDMVRRQNRELDSQRRVVEEANRLKSEFLSNMSHELRTPLNSILALSRVLSIQSSKKLDEEEIGYIEIIERNGRNLLALINDILDLSKIEAGRVDLNPKAIHLRSVLGVIIENFEQMAETKGIALTLRVPDDLPDIVTDGPRLYQIFQNIIGNAVKFTEEGSVDVSAVADGFSVTVIVRDTGIGIAEKDLPFIFDEFRQIDGTLTRKYEGTGLGLSIAARSAQLISAIIDVESEPGRGSTFSVTIPLFWHGDMHAAAPDAVANGDRNAGSRARISTAARHKGARKRVLIIEDDDDNMFTLRTLLQDDYDLLEAQDGETGLRLVMEERPDLVLLDMALPVMSGITVIERIRQDPSIGKVPVIAVTALSMDGDRERILDAGCNAYLSKPYDIHELVKTIDEWLGGS